MMDIRIEMMALDDLVRWVGNPKGHDMAMLDKSIERFGFVAPLTIDEGTGRLVAGHGRVEALSRMREEGREPPERIQVDGGGRWLVPVIRGVRFADSAEAEAYLLADNRLVERGGWDEGLLADALSGLRQMSVEPIGWTDVEVDEIIALASVEQGSAPTKAPKGGGDLVQTWDSYIDAEIKQVTFYFSEDVYARVVADLQEIMEAESSESHSDVLLLLIERYRAASG